MFVDNNDAPFHSTTTSALVHLHQSTHLVVRENALKVVVGREAHASLDRVSNHDGTDTGIQASDTALLDSVLENAIGSEFLSNVS